MTDRRIALSELNLNNHTITAVDKETIGPRFATWELSEGIVFDNRVVINFIAALRREVALGVWSLQRGGLMPRYAEEHFRTSRAHQLEYPDGWHIQIRPTYADGALSIVFGEIDGKSITSAKEAGIILPHLWEAKRIKSYSN